MDTDGDGSVDMKEFSAWMKSTDVLATHLRVRMERTSGVPPPARRALGRAWSALHHRPANTAVEQ